MINEEYKEVGLYDHNASSYKEVKTSFDKGEEVVGIVHATGTGKSYNALQLAYDNKDKKIVYIVPSNSIIEHIKKIINDNPNLDKERDFPNLEFRTYYSLVSLNRKEIESIDCDLLILDEFHHIGAPVWGARVNTMIETHPNTKIFGMTAYTVRDRGTSYERDMANPDTDELFSRKIVSRYDLCDAMIDGVLPKPIYKSAYTNLMGLERELEERVQKLNASSKEYQEYMAILSDVKRRIHEAPSIPNILKKSIKPNGKYIYFCPPFKEEGTNDIETIKKEALNWFKDIADEDDMVFYTTTSEMREEGKKNRDAFYDDTSLDGEKVDNKLRIMFAINQYNEGVHAPNIDGVIMGRGTTSDIVYFEQLGRALSVRGNTKEQFEELEKHSLEELMAMCKYRDIPIKENDTKEDLINKLIAPVVIDLTNNYEFIKNLENNLKDRIKEVQSRGPGNHRDIKIRDASFDIEIENQDLYEMLRDVFERLTITWEDYYELAKAYYEHHGNLLIPQNFKTNDGYNSDNENGCINLGGWIQEQRKRYSKLSPERQRLLELIGFVEDAHENKWQNNYELAKAYYEYYGNLLVPNSFKTNDGHTGDPNGNVNLGKWINNQRTAFKNGKLSLERKQLLDSIGMIYNKNDQNWLEHFKYAKIYYEHYNNLSIPWDFKTSDGYTGDPNGNINLGKWIGSQRTAFKNGKLSPERKQLLDSIGMIYNKNDQDWLERFKYAKIYYEHYNNLLIPQDFKTNDGYTKDPNGDINLGSWISVQRQDFKDKRLLPERKQLLDSIGMIYNKNDQDWLEIFKYAKIYYEYHNNLLIPYSFKTNNGYTGDPNGDINLGSWISVQRQAFNNNQLLPERKQLLDSIGMEYDYDDLEERWQKFYKYAKIYYDHYGNLMVPYNFKTNDGYTGDPNGKVNLGMWISDQKKNFKKSKLLPRRIDLLDEIGMVWEPLKKRIPWEEMYEYAKVYYEHYGNLLIPQSFKTNDGYTKDPNGNINLGRWIANQRNLISPDSEKGQLLSSIGMIWNVKKNKQEILSICSEYNIDTIKNEKVIEHILVQELEAKIEFLKDNNIPIVDSDGVLIDIFTMSSTDMKEKYGVTLEELIDEYYIKKQKGKGV